MSKIIYRDMSTMIDYALEPTFYSYYHPMLCF